VTTLHGLATSALRRLDAEDAHGLAITALKLGLGPRGAPDDPILATRLAGLSLPNPIGLAAGFDKNAEVFAPMLRAGFGFVECGTVTPLAQPGNPRPRLFRLTEDQAVINRLGFNNGGLEAYAARLAAGRGEGVVGGNFGANKDSEDRIGDYVIGLRRLWGLADYFTVNISSPNTPGLRALQTKAALEELLGRLAEARAALPGAPGPPVFLKVAPDLDAPEVVVISEAVARFGLQGVIVGNTTLSRPEGLTSPLREESGGLSGKPLEDLASRMVRLFRIALAPGLVVIGCGGVSSGAGAFAKIRAGASAVQLYSALVFAGPQLVGTIKRDLGYLLRANGFASVEDAVGMA
jgi:dihydroorotate dehydrogenase